MLINEFRKLDMNSNNEFNLALQNLISKFKKLTIHK